MTYGGSVHIDTELWIYLPTPLVVLLYEFGLSIITILFLLCTQFAWIK